jgi:hypothetical protein
LPAIVVSLQFYRLLRTLLTPGMEAVLRFRLFYGLGSFH